MATRQREISVSEFFAKNRHLLGFDNPSRALLTTVKEAVDNSLDACEEAEILPDIFVEIRHLPHIAADRFLVIVQDNGPGIVRKQIENIFGKLLYGSKFHRLKMSRGQQGIGISAAGMYGLITTGKPVRIISKTAKNKPSHEVILKMDTSKNKADVVSDNEHPEDDHIFPQGHGTRVEIELQGKYAKGGRSVDEYIHLTAIANPHGSFTFVAPPTSAFPDGQTLSFPRSVDELPEQPQEIKPHPHGIELGTLIGMLERTEHAQLGGFFTNEFCRIGPKVAQTIAEQAGLTPRTSVKKVGHAEAEKLFAALQSAKVIAPPTNCLSPIGVKTLLKGLESGLQPDFIAASSRPPSVYRGRPFVIEAGIAYGGNLSADETARVYRYANRVPLQYQQSACCSFKAVADTSWRNYGLQQPKNGIPTGPMVVLIHMASVWVPFTSESKEAIADYDEIRKEMRLALQECGRKLGSYLRKRQRMKRAGERRGVFLRYIGEISKACENLTGTDAQQLYNALIATAETKTFEVDIELDEEGKVVNTEDLGRLNKDESVLIRDPTMADDLPARGSDLNLQAIADEAEQARAQAAQSAAQIKEPKPSRQAAASASPAPEVSPATNLFGEEDPEPAAGPARRKVKKKTKKKVRRKA